MGLAELDVDSNVFDQARAVAALVPMWDTVEVVLARLGLSLGATPQVVHIWQNALEIALLQQFPVGDLESLSRFSGTTEGMVALRRLLLVVVAALDWLETDLTAWARETGHLPAPAGVS